MSTKKTPALRSAWALMLVVPLAALVPPGRPPRTTKLDAATLARRREPVSYTHLTLPTKA